MRPAKGFLLFLSLFVLTITKNASAQNAVGIFDGQTDVGNIKLPGGTKYNAEEQQYQITGSGANIWFDHAAFHYVWKKIKGDFILTTRAEFLGKGVELHRKMGWMG